MNDAKVRSSIFISLLYSLALAKSESNWFSSILVSFFSPFTRCNASRTSRNQLRHNISRIIPLFIQCDDANIECLLQLEHTRVLCERAFHQQWTAKETFLPGAHSKGILLTANETDSADKSWRAILFGQYIERDRTRNTSRAIAPTCIPNARERCGRRLQLWSLRADLLSLGKTHWRTPMFFPSLILIY